MRVSSAGVNVTFAAGVLSLVKETFLSIDAVHSPLMGELP